MPKQRVATIVGKLRNRDGYRLYEIVLSPGLAGTAHTRVAVCAVEIWDEKGKPTKYFAFSGYSTGKENGRRYTFAKLWNIYRLIKRTGNTDDFDGDVKFHLKNDLGYKVIDEVSDKKNALIEKAKLKLSHDEYNAIVENVRHG